MPFSKIYRAFPELDRFTDAQCAEWVRLARRDNWPSMIGFGVGLVVVLMPVAGAALAVASKITEAIATSRFGGRIAQSLRVTIDDVDMMLKAPAIIGVLVMVYLVAALVRDRTLRRVIMSRLKSGRCTACDYTLLGLKPQGTMVTCPECGIQLDLRDLGLTPAAIMAPAGDERATGESAGERR